MSLDMGQPSQANTKKLLGKKYEPSICTEQVGLCFGGASKAKTTMLAVQIVKVFDIFVCLLGTRKSFDHLISDSKAPKRPEMESGMTTPPKMRRVAENDYEIGKSTTDMCCD